MGVNMTGEGVSITGISTQDHKGEEHYQQSHNSI